MNKKISSVTLESLPKAAKDLLEMASQNPVKEGEESHPRRIFAFYGQLGAGKTTLIKELCRQLGSNDNFSSPSYSIVNEYLLDGKEEAIYHIDLYRLKSLDEAMAIGVEEYLYGEFYCFIEWPEVIEFLLPPNTVKIRLKTDENMREISIFMG